MKKRILFSVVLAFTTVFSLPTMAGEAIVNSEITVEATGKDAAEARTDAMAKANADALKDLLNKLAAPGQADTIISALDPKKITSMARGTEVLEEKIGDKSYRARLLISFDADEVSNLITQYGLGSSNEAVASKTSSFLFLTSYEEDGTTLLWEERNPWRAAWKNLGLENNTGDIVVPYGDNNDQGIVDMGKLATVTYATLAPLAIRYGISDVVILQAKYTKNPDMVLTVVKRRINRNVNEVNALTYRADLQETRDTLLARAARDIADNLLNKKNEEIASGGAGVVSHGEKGKIMMLASITTIGSWTSLKAKLETLPMIERLEMLALSPSQVDMVVHYRGSLESLEGGITGVGLRLAKNKDYWVISRD
jgi:Uncharacterized protein conserved in bacteria (DUF2066)